MANELVTIPDFDDIVFEIRNKEYGAYKLRKKYSRSVLIGLLLGIAAITAAVVTPYLNARAIENQKLKAERQVVIKMDNLDQPSQEAPPPPPPPPPPPETVAPLRYVAPIVVDTIKPEETKLLMTADQAQAEIKNEEVVLVQEVQVEVKEEEKPEEIFVVVEEMPVFPGGQDGMMKYIYANIKYPDAARENNIQGRVTVSFIVNSKGLVDNVTLIKGVDPSLDNEAIRVVKSIPPWKPGKQGGRAVSVKFSVPISFRLNAN